jgi:dTDP-glucose pyrophosphorylase
MKKRIRLGVIPAAGEGRRMGYLSDVLPKCLFPLYDKPIIHYVVENMVKTGIKKIVIPIYSKKERISEYFEQAKEDIDAEICLLPLKKLPRGIALSIQTTEPMIDEEFMVILGDDITIVDSFQPLIDVFFSSKAVAVEAVVKEKEREVVRRTCCVELRNDGRIVDIAEKPQKPRTDLRGCGVYVFAPEIFEYICRTPILPPRDEVEITNTIGLAAKEGKAYGFQIEGVNINVNTPDDLYKAWSAVMKSKKNI